MEPIEKTSTRSDTNVACPTCGLKGRPVGRITVESNLLEDAKARVDAFVGFRLCANRACGTSYYRPGAARFETSDVRVPIFQKETDPDRLVCYCFEHRVNEIRDEVRITGASVVPDDIADKCKQGLDRCEERNPQGICCLGNVRAVVKEARARVRRAPGPTSVAVQGVNECCAPKASNGAAAPAKEATPSWTGLVAAGGAVVVAVLSSACCWLPLMLIGAGASAAGVGSIFEGYRPWLLGGTVGLLAAGFYLVYVRKPGCTPSGACEAPGPRRQRTNRIVLWMATAFVTALALFPSYVGLLVDDPAPPAAVAEVTSPAVTLGVEGMTCAGCQTNVKAALEGVRGVRSAAVSFEDKTARIRFEGPAVQTEVLLAALEKAGYRGVLPRLPRIARLRIEGMSCEACVAGLIAALKEVQGVDAVEVSYSDRMAFIRVTTVSDTVLVAAVEAAGYTATVDKSARWSEGS